MLNLLTVKLLKNVKQNMINQAGLEALYSATYVENYFDCVENLPDDIQRHITRMCELDICYQNLQKDLNIYHNQIIDSKDNIAFRKKTLLRIQRLLIAVQEIGDEKLGIVQQIQDCIENKSRQLEYDYKNLIIGCEPECKETHKDSLLGQQQDKTTKRSRRTMRISDGIDTENERPTDKMYVGKRSGSKKKKKQNKNDKESRNSAEEMPIDPNEPTYCLCEQVSFGEMIGCDNDLCPIEWFHFSCVSLTTKPKGKWFCPRCRGDKPTVMKPKAQFLKELQRYNKEKEEKNNDKL